VYQPRGVGLMHTRHKPSNPHYTHAKAMRRKYCLLRKAPRVIAEVRAAARVVNCHFGRLAGYGR
jgi:hypothetical protein